MGKKLYADDGDGGIRVISRRMGHVRIPNYVYDLWMPIIGVKGIGVYGVYCRLERESEVKAISQLDLAKACRIGVNSLRDTNDLLERLGFIKVTPPPPEGKLRHWTTVIEVFDPPEEVPQDIVAELGHPSGYAPLSIWLVEAPALPNGNTGDTSQMLDVLPNGNAMVEDLEVENLEIANLDTTVADATSESDKEFTELFGESDYSTSGEKRSSLLRTQEGKDLIREGLAEKWRAASEEADLWDRSAAVGKWLDQHKDAPRNKILEVARRFESTLGSIPVLNDFTSVKTWLSGIWECLKIAHDAGKDDVRLVVVVAQKMREEGLAMKNPHSCKGMVSDAMAQIRMGTYEWPDRKASRKLWNM